MLLYDGPKIKTTTEDFVGRKERANESSVGRHIPSGKAKAKAKARQRVPLGNSAHDIKCGVSAIALMAKTQKGYLAIRTEGEVPRAKFSKTGAKINCNNGQERQLASQKMKTDKASKNKGG